MSTYAKRRPEKVRVGNESLGRIQEIIHAKVFWPLALLMGAFAATALVVPLLAPISIHDDWVYARSVEILMSQGKFTILDLSSAVNPFQTLWAGMFAMIFGNHLGVFRLSTFVLVLVSGPALYGICRELGLGRHQAVLGTAIYLFNPVLFSLAYTFMTDPHFVALLVISAYFYLRGLQRESWQSIVAGSVAAACAFLVRQPGFLIPGAVMTYLLLSRRLSFTVKSFRLALQVVGIPVLVAILYLLWLTFVQVVPGGSSDFAQSFTEAPLGERVELLWQLGFITLMYLGWFILPLAVSVAPRIVSLVRSLSPRHFALVSVGLAIVLGGLVDFALQGRLMPYLPALDKYAFGPASLIGDRPQLVDDRTLKIFTVIVALSSIILIIAVVARLKSVRERNLGAGLLLSIAWWQALGVFVASHWFRKDLISIDRYVLVLMPFAICLFLRRFGKLDFSRGAAWALTALIAIFTVAGTRDFVVFHQEVWNLAADARRMGIPANKLDAGASWDGYFVSDGTNIVRQTKTQNPPWWIVEFAPQIDSTYLVSTSPVDGYSAFLRRRYSQWLHSEDTYLYLSQRGGPPVCPPLCPPAGQDS